MRSSVNNKMPCAVLVGFWVYFRLGALLTIRHLPRILQVRITHTSTNFDRVPVTLGLTDCVARKTGGQWSRGLGPTFSFIPELSASYRWPQDDKRCTDCFAYICLIPPHN
ncbi:hypothetical protein F5X98DRAFT_171185 [Xylaria grammica]|nr:hypothetical protein F5X98DRAFT_171185 [Xylaria grammica]